MAKHKMAYALSAVALTLGSGILAPAVNANEMPTSCTGIDNCAVISSAEDLIGFFPMGEGKFVSRVGKSTMIIGDDFTMTKDLYINGVDLDIYLGSHVVTASDYSFLFYDSNVNIYGESTGSLTNAEGYYAPLYVRSGSHVTINGGTISGGQSLYMDEYNPEAAVIVDDEGELVLQDGLVTSMTWGVTVWKDAAFTMNGGKVAATGEGSIGVSGNGSDSGVGARITINGGEITSGELGIYAPQQQGVTTINGGEIDGLAGVEIRAGSLTVAGGTINVPADTEYQISANGNGSTTTGTAIAVAQHTTKQAINVTVTGGTFIAPVPFSEANPQYNDAEDVQKVSLSIAGGTFEATNGDPIVTSEDVKHFISGGFFSKEPSAEYLAEGCVVALQDDKLSVVNPDELELANEEIETIQTEDGEVNIVMPKAVDYSEAEAIEAADVSEDAVSGHIRFEDGFIGDRISTLVMIQTDADELTVDATKGGDLFGAFDIEMTDRYGETIDVKDTVVRVFIDLPEEVYEELAAYDKVEVVYFEDGEEVERLAAEVVADEDLITGEPYYYLTFVTTHFSIYGVVGVNEAAAPDTGAATSEAGSSVNYTGLIAAVTVMTAIVVIAEIVKFAKRKQHKTGHTHTKIANIDKNKTQNPLEKGDFVIF